ncbi:MAG: efflux RND transporter permease subunit [Firmicutes bacterium]|nr:efflux RND transporter permease subunit [Bacillota bacterium]
MSKYSVKKPLTIIVVVIIIIALGIVSVLRMTPDLLPSIDLPYVVVMTTYPGATPEEVTEEVTKPLEQNLATLENLKTIQSLSSANYSLVVLEFENGSSMDTAMVNTLQNVDMVAGGWDDTIGSPYIMKINPTMIPIMVAAVDMEGKDTESLSNFVNDTLMNELEGTTGVASVQAGGLLRSQINVLLDPEKIDKLNNKLIAKINKEMAEAREEINKGIAEVDSALSEMGVQKNQLAAAKQQAIGQIDNIVDSAYTTIDNAKRQAEKLIDQAQDTAQEVTEDMQEIVLEGSNAQSMEELQESFGKVEDQLDKISDLDFELPSMPSIPSSGQIKGTYRSLIQGVDTIQQAETQIAVAEAQLQSTRAQLVSARDELDAQAEEALKQADLGSMITMETISGILKGQNFDMPAGYIQKKDGTRYLVSVGDKLEDEDEVKDLYIFNVEGIGDIYLKDVAEVFTSDNSSTTYASINGKPGVLLTFSRQSNYATATASNNIKDKFEKLENKYKGLEFSVLMDQGDYIYLIMNAIAESLLYGALFAIIVLLLFLRDIKPTFITLLSIPISLTFAIVLMYFSGVTINLISLSGLAVAVGMLVDNSIVVIENIFRLRRQGVDPKRAAVAGAKEVGAAIISSTLTTVCVFAPIVFVQGLTRELFSDMALTLAFSLAASLLVALTLVPALASRMFTKDPKPEGGLYNWTSNVYKRLLNWNLNHKFIILLIVVILLVFSVQSSLSKGFIFIPDMSTPQMSGTLTMDDEEATIDETAEIADRALKLMKKVDGVETAGGMLSTSSDLGSLSGDVSSTIVSLYVVLDPETERTSKEIADEIIIRTKHLPCTVDILSSSSITEYTTALGGKGVTIELYSTDNDSLQEAAKDVGDKLAEIKGVKSVDNGLRDAEPEYHFIVNKSKAMAKGLTVAQVYLKVSEALRYENTATSLSIGNDTYDVVVASGKATSMTLKKLKNLEIAEGVKLKSVATVEKTESLPSINRKDQQTFISVTAEAEEGQNITLLTDKCKSAMEKFRLPDGVRYEFRGENETIMDAMDDLLKMMALGILLVYLIMVAQFQSFKSPFIVMFTIPLAFTGGFMALILFGKEVSIIAMIGLIILNGVVVNNGIVLVDYTNQLRARGMNKRAAILTAGATRMRPVLMTSVTTILGLVVLAMGRTAGTDMMQPVALVCIGGLIYATLLTLLVVPVIYDLFNGEKYHFVRARDIDVSDLIVQ